MINKITLQKEIKKKIKELPNSNLIILTGKSLNKLLNIKDAKIQKSNGLFSNKTFMITGKLERISRAEVKSLIEENSGSTISNVSKKLDYLIVGDKPTKRKIESAKELKIKIITQSEWLKMLNKTT